MTLTALTPSAPTCSAPRPLNVAATSSPVPMAPACVECHAVVTRRPRSRSVAVGTTRFEVRSPPLHSMSCCRKGRSEPARDRATVPHVDSSIQLQTCSAPWRRGFIRPCRGSTSVQARSRMSWLISRRSSVEAIQLFQPPHRWPDFRIRLEPAPTTPAALLAGPCAVPR